MDKNQLLRALPKVDELLRRPELAQAQVPVCVLTDLVRLQVEELRSGILSGTISRLPDTRELCQRVLSAAHAAALPSLRQVVNATGVILHTNLGRACLSEAAAQAVCDISRRCSTLEYDPVSGSRGSRHDHVQSLLCRLTGAESAMVVNNNAAAVLLILSSMGSGGEIVISRGELVEIGGSFRIPEIVEQCGCRLREVGATNKTRLRDYRAAVCADTRALFKVHTSNYRIVGFTESVPLPDLVALGQECGLPVIEDLGSGSLIDLKPLGICDEPAVTDSVKAGVDVISFSGDKLVGGPQAGIIVGKKKWLDRFRSHPLARALRVDKMTLAALEATLCTYLDPRQALEEIPTLRMLAADPQQLNRRAQRLQALLQEQGVASQVIEVEDQVGGGSVPCQRLEGYGVAIASAALTVDELDRTLRSLDRPIVGRIAHDRYLLDVRTLWEDELSYIAREVGEVLS